jgi:hypothetical protein
MGTLQREQPSSMPYRDEHLSLDFAQQAAALDANA